MTHGLLLLLLLLDGLFRFVHRVLEGQPVAAADGLTPQLNFFEEVPQFVAVVVATGRRGRRGGGQIAIGHPLEIQQRLQTVLVFPEPGQSLLDTLQMLEQLLLHGLVGLLRLLLLLAAVVGHGHFRRRGRVESAAARTRVAVAGLGAETGIRHRIVARR